MKKISLFLIVGLMFLMTACEKEIIEVEDDIDSEIDLHPTDIYEGEDDFIFLVNNSQSGIATMERYFQVEFTSLKYTPIKNEVCFSFDMTDEEFPNATYYLILQEKGSMVTLQQMSFTLGSESTTNGGCFNAMSKEITYEILVGKTDRDDLNPTSYIDAVGSIEFKDPNFDERSKLGNISFEHEALEEYTEDHLPYIKYGLTIGDEDEIISDISIFVYEADFNILVKQIDYNITSVNRNNSNIILRNILIDDLAPNVEYIVYVKINGNDNISDFEDILIRHETVKTPHITFGSGVSYHSLFIDII